MLVVTSHSAAMARGSSHAVDQMVICSGTTVTVVYVDAEGQPIDAPHLCPDCALHLLAALVPAATQPVPVTGAPEMVLGPTQALPAGAPWSSASARAPPFDVL
ncbi:MAG: hypothetical protein AAGF36_01610 [Pseudomonadota bacterium]